MKRAIRGAGHTINQATRITGHAWPAVDPIELISTVTTGDDCLIYPAKPLRHYVPNLRQRMAAAWLVLIGRAAAVRWLTHE